EHDRALTSDARRERHDLLAATEEEVLVLLAVSQEAAPRIERQHRCGRLALARASLVAVSALQQRLELGALHGERERSRNTRLEAERGHAHLLLEPPERPSFFAPDRSSA